MKKISITAACILVCMACLFMVFAAGCSTADESGSGEVLAEGDKAPDFTADLLGGGEFTLSDHKDDIVLINFWATWCGFCVEEMPELEKLDKENIEGLEIILVDCMESKQEVDDFIKENGYTFSVAYDEDGSIEAKYPTSGIPYTVIIKDGVVRKTFEGAPPDPYDAYKSAVEELL